jgi:histidinol-phosphate aminotransferase
MELHGRADSGPTVLWPTSFSHSQVRRALSKIPAMISRRSLFKTAAFSAAAAASATFPAELFSWAEPSRAPQPGGPILLNSNENAYGPLSAALALPNPFKDANRYPDSTADLLKKKLAKLHKVGTDQVVLGCGSTEILKMAASAFTGPDRKLVMAAPTFEAIGSYAEAMKAPVVRVPLAESQAHHLAAMAGEAANKGGLVYICNPNNPTGSVTPRRGLENFVRELPKDVYVVMDEAYHDFVPVSADYISFISTPVNDDRVIVARTFSKIYGMAGLRLGYAIASPKTARLLAAQKLEDNANIFALRCALASLDDTANYETAVLRNANDRSVFMHEAGLRKIPLIPSWTNFVMINALRPVRGVIEHFKKNNIRIGRPFPPMDTWARISLGTPEQMKAFWQVWDTLPKA